MKKVEITTLKKEHPPVLLIDMDCILVDMGQYWLDVYREAGGEKVDFNDVVEYDMTKAVKDPFLFLNVLHREGFFVNMKPMPGAEKYMDMLIDKGFDVVILTQPPRNSVYAVREKTEWVQKYIPKYDTSNMVFCHRKELVHGDVLFDDRPSHLINWAAKHRKGITATIVYSYNKNTFVNLRCRDKQTAWEEFHDRIVSYYCHPEGIM